MAVFSEVELGKVSTLTALERLEETSNDQVNMIIVKESLLKQKNLVRLEEVTKFMNDNSLSLAQILESIARVNDIHMESIGFSVFPSNLLEDVDVYKNALILKEEGFPIYTDQNPGDSINECFSQAIAEAITTGNTKTFDEMIEIFNERYGLDVFTNAVAKKSAPGIAKNSATNLVGALGHVVANGARQGLAQAGENLINKKVFGYANNKTVDDPLGATDSSGNLIKVSKMDAALRRAIPNQDVADFASTTVKGITNAASKTGVNKLMSLLKLGGSNIDPQEQLNRIQHQTAVMSSRIGNTKDPRTRNMLQKMYDKLVNLKNKLLARIRGNKS